MKVGDLVKLGAPWMGHDKSRQHLGLCAGTPAIITSIFESAAGYTVCVLRTADKENKEVRILDFDLEVISANR